MTTPSTQARPRVLVVGAGLFQVGLLRAAKDVAEVVAVDGSSLAPGLPLADHARVIDVRDSRAIVDLARELKVDGVLTGASDVAVPAVSAVVDELGLIGLPAAVAERCRDKQQAFEAVRAAGLAVPETRAVSSLARAEQVIDEVGGYPAVIKPRSGGGGRGVSVVRSAAELPDAMRRAQAAYLGLGESGVLVQQWVDGRSLGTEAFFVDGKLVDAFVMDDQFDEDYVSPVGHSLPPQVDRELHDAVVRACEAFGVALGLTTGAVNFDLRCGEQIQLIEVNPRLGGNSITDLVYEAYGSRVAHAAVACVLGRDPRPYLARAHHKPVAARLILTHGRGVVRFTKPPMAHASRPDVIAIDLTVGDGERTTVHVDDFCLLGRCVVTGPDAAGAARAAEVLAREIAATARVEQVDQGTA